MAKKIMQDFIPNDKRTIRRIRVDRNGQRNNSNKTEEESNNVEVKKVEETQEDFVDETEDLAASNSMSSFDGTNLPPKPARLRSESNAGRFWIWGVGIVVLVVLIVAAASLIFSGAKLKVTPRQENVVINGQFTAYAEPEFGELGFEVMTLSQSVSRSVKATGEEQVDTKASGIITVFNNFDGNTQRLIKNTRFETPEGLIYRIQESVVVPGMTEDENGEAVPGSIDVEVYADTSGEEYNIGLTDFTIPGFDEAGDPRFFKFFARSKTPMTGGFSGLKKTVSADDEERARAEMQTELTDILSTQASAQVPEGFVLYDDAIFIDFTEKPNAGTAGSEEATLTEEAKLYGFILPEAGVAEVIAENTIASYEGSEVRFIDLNELAFAVVDGDLIEPVSLEDFDFTLNGEGLVVWDFDEQRLKEDFAGKHRRDTDMVLSAYPAIERAEVHLRPFWKRIFPENSEKIKIEELITE